MTMDTTDKAGGALGLITSIVAILVELGGSLIEAMKEIGWHCLLCAMGTLTGLIIARLWKKYVDKKKDESNNH